MKHLYFRWLYQLVFEDREIRSYKKLLQFLFDQDFYYLLDMDSNRGVDGLDLRYRFCYDNKYEYSKLGSELGDKPCSVLEVMIAIALRFEEETMRDWDIGDRTPIWFFCMLTSLGLDDMDDYNFDEARVSRTISRFLNRDYCANGIGGLFYIPDCGEDLREVDLWAQASWFFDRQL